MGYPKQTDSTKTEIQQYGWDGAAWRENRIDSFSRSATTISLEHERVHAGRHYMVSAFMSRDIGQTIEFGVKPSATGTCHMSFDFGSTDTCEFYIYEGAGGVTGGVAVIPMNNNRNVERASTTDVRSNITVATTGTLLYSSSIGARNQGGFYHRDNEIILKKDTWYLFRFISKINDNVITYAGTWYETDDRTGQGDRW